MKCHGHNVGNQKHSMLNHMLHMILCCGLPIAIIGFLPFITKFSPGAAGLLAIIAPFICPLMMVGMMVVMMRGNKEGNCCDNKNTKNDNLNKFTE